MLISEAIKILQSYLEGGGDDELVIGLHMPSIGARASVGVRDLGQGMDWDHGKVFICPAESVTTKSNYQTLGEEAQDILMYIATKPQKNPSYEVRCARHALEAAGIEYKKYAYLFHEGTKRGEEQIK